jgi:hypothetical protein
MKNKDRIIVIIYLVFIVLKTNAQNTTFNNVAIGTDYPGYGVAIKSNFPGYTGGWGRGFFVTNETGSQPFFTFASIGTTVNGVSSITSSFIGKDLDNRYMTFLPNGNVGIGNTNPSGKLEISGSSAIYSDFASYSGTTINSVLPNGKEPTLIVNENPKGTLQYAVGGQVTYRGGISFGRGGPGIYSINPNPAGSGYYGELRFHTTYWNGSDYNNADRMVIKLDGNVGIGTTNPTSKLTVAGNINSREVKVTVDAGADFVFEKDYDLPSLSSLDSFIKENKHLPEIASAKEMQENGINLSEMNIKLLQKMEEMTLYIIEQEKRINIQSSKIEILEKENQTFNSLSERLSKLESQSNK